MLVVAAQSGPVTTDPAAAVRSFFEMVGDLEAKPDLVVLPELFSLPFWCVGLADDKFFDWAESTSGPTIGTVSEYAAHLGCHVVVPFFERGEVAGEYYNSAAVVGPDGELVPGTLPGGRGVMTYRKCAISSYSWDSARNDEKFYFRGGPGFPVFETAIGTIGILICYDRWFPEAWRVLALQGADFVCVPTASSGPGARLFHSSVRTWAAENVLYVVAANRAGTEAVGGTSTDYFGLSCVASPRGELVAADESGQPEKLVVASIDVAEVEGARHDLTMYRDRRPELYRLIGEV